MPKVSVIVPVYNVEPYLHRCVDSILAQTFTDFELILVDDGSPDNCPSICDEYAKKDNRVVVIHQNNGGLSAARNAGIDWSFANSDSEWITFIDSDDWVHKQCLEVLYTVAKKSNVSCVSAKHLECTTSISDGIIENPNVAVLDSESFFVEQYKYAVISCAKFYKRDLFDYIRFPDNRLHE